MFCPSRPTSFASTPPGAPDPSRRSLLIRGSAAIGLTLGPAAAFAQATPSPSGLWVSSAGDHLILLQDAGGGQTFGLQIPASLQSLRVWVGSGSPSQILLQSLTSPNDVFSASITQGTQLAGTQSARGVATLFNASLALAWAATEYAGIWQKSSPDNAYLAFCQLKTATAALAVQIDVTVQPDGTLSHDVFTGVLNSDTFNGLSITGSGYTSRLVFAGKQLQGTQIASRQGSRVTYTANQIVKIAA